MTPLEEGCEQKRADSPYLADEELVRALAPTGEKRTVDRHQRLFSSGETALGVYLILKGTAQARMAVAEREVMRRTAGPGSVLGLPSALCAHRYEFDAQALEPVEAVFLETGAVNQILKQQPELCIKMMNMMCDELDALRHTREHMQRCENEACGLREQCRQACSQSCSGIIPQ